MKRRINIASAILHTPKILLMDEPTVGVDPQSRSHIFEIVEKLNNDGMTIIYTTHYMEEAEHLCDTIAIIDSGNIVASGTIAELRKISDVKDLLTIKVTDINDKKMAQLNESITFKVDSTSNLLKVECSNIGKEISGIISHLQNADVTIESIDTKRANLESIFLKLTGKRLRA